MLLTKSRISVVAIVIISLLLAFTLFRMAERASADNAAGAIPGAFGDNAALKDPIGWDWNAQGTSMTVNLFLDPLWANKVYGMEVFVAPAAGEAPVQTQFLGNFGPFPTGRTLCFIFTTSKQANKTLPTAVGIHLIDQTKATLVISEAPRNSASNPLPAGNLITAGAPCIEAESADPTPTTSAPTPTPTRAPAPTATPTTKPPVTGDFTPGSGMLMGLLLAGFVLITAGGAYIIQTRPSRVRNS